MKTEVKGVLDVCYHCCSNEISEISSGYVCRTCGTVQETMKFESKAFLEKTQFQYNIISKTTIGNEGERKMAKNSGKIQYLSKLDSITVPYEDKILYKALSLGNTILEKLGRSLKDKYIILDKFREILPYFLHRTKFKSPEKCIPWIIYFYYKEMNIVIDLKTLLEVSEIEKSEFVAFRKKMKPFWSAYKTRDRKKYILTRIGGIIGYGKLHNQSMKILDKFWGIINDSKDDVIAGLVIGIAITLSKCEKLTLYSLCKSLNITQSSLQKSIQNKLFDRLGIRNKVKGFKKKVEFISERKRTEMDSKQWFNIC